MERSGDAAEPGSQQLRYLLAFVVLTVLQYGSILPVMHFLVLTFFAASHGGGHCEETPDSGPCRRAASDVALYFGVAFGIAHGIAWLVALVLGSWSDRVGRRPLIQAKALLSVLPVMAVALHVFAGTTLLVYLVVIPIYEAFDVNGAILGFVADVVVDPRERTEAYSALLLALILAAGPAVLLGGWLSATAAVSVALTACAAKVLFVLVLLPETAETSDTRPVGLLPTASAALELVGRSAFISRVASVFALSGLSLVGLGTVAKPYLTGYLGVDRSTGTRLASVCGASVVITIVTGLKPLVARLGEVRALQLCLAFAAALPLMYCACSKVWHVFVLAALFSGPMVMQFPIIAAIKSNLVTKDEQGLMQGALAASRVLAEAISGAFFSAFYRSATAGGAAPERSAAFPPLVAASGLGALAWLVACTLPERLPSPQPKRQEGAPALPAGALVVGTTRYASLG